MTTCAAYLYAPMSLTELQNEMVEATTKAVAQANRKNYLLAATYFGEAQRNAMLIHARKDEWRKKRRPKK